MGSIIVGPGSDSFFEDLAHSRRHSLTFIIIHRELRNAVCGNWIRGGNLVWFPHKFPKNYSELPYFFQNFSKIYQSTSVNLKFLQKYPKIFVKTAPKCGWNVLFFISAKNLPLPKISVYGRYGRPGTDVRARCTNTKLTGEFNELFHYFRPFD